MEGEEECAGQVPEGSNGGRGRRLEKDWGHLDSAEFLRHACYRTERDLLLDDHLDDQFFSLYLTISINQY